MKQIDGVPESITHEQYLALVAGAGFDVKRVRKLEFRMDGIYAEVPEHKVSCGLKPDGSDDDVIVHRVFIPVDG